MTKRADIDKDRLGVAGILLATLLLAGPATATPVTLAETAADSEAVIYGEIVARSFVTAQPAIPVRAGAIAV
jgi:hypothetical protein